MIACYVRVSSAHQREEQTIDSQLAMVLAAAEAAGAPVDPAHIYRDDGVSGATLQRPALDALRDAIAQGQIRQVWIYAPDRLSRKYAYQVLLLEEWQRGDCTVQFVRAPHDTSPEGALLTELQGIIAEYERAQIYERTRRGKLHKARQGVINVLSGAPYGYVYHRRTETSLAQYTIHPAQGPVVQQIFTWYTTDHWTIGEVTRTLTARAIPTQTGKMHWDRSTVWGILRNPAYAGQAAFGKTTRIAQRPRLTRRTRLQGKLQSARPAARSRDAADWITIAVPALVSIAQWTTAQRRLEENRKFAQRHTKTVSVCQGLTVCARCGYSYYRTSVQTSKQRLRYYRCLGSDAWRWPGGRMCTNRPVREDVLDQLVWEQVAALLADPHVIQEEWARRQQVATAPASADADREHDRLQQARRRMVDGYQEGLITMDDFRARVQRLDQRLQVLAQEAHVRAQQAAEAALYPVLTQSWETFRQAVQHGLETSTVEGRQTLVRLVVRQVTIDVESITIHHVIPVHPPHLKSYPLRWRSPFALVGQYPAGPGRLGQGTRTASPPLRPLCGRL